MFVVKPSHSRELKLSFTVEPRENELRERIPVPHDNFFKAI